jgi:hypothetical protein
MIYIAGVKKLLLLKQFKIITLAFVKLAKLSPLLAVVHSTILFHSRTAFTDAFFSGNLEKVNISQSSVLALFLLALCLFGSPIAELALLISFGIVILIIFSAKNYDYFLLCVLFLISDGVRNFSNLSEDEGIKELSSSWQPISKIVSIDSMTSFIAVNSIQVTLPLITGLCLLVFFIVNFSIKRVFDICLLSILVVCFASSYYGYLQGNNGYSTGVYISFPLLAVYWGTFIRITPVPSWISTFFRYSYLGLIGCAVGLIQGHLIFLILGISGAMTWFYLIHRKYVRSFVTVFCALFIVINTTYTLFVMFFVSSALGFLIVYRQKVLSQYAARAVYIVLVFTVSFLLYFAVTFDRFSYSYNSQFIGKAFDKFALDRTPVWKGAYKMIVDTGELISPSNRSYNIVYNGLKRNWDVGAHNIFLEVFRQVGWLGGTIISVMILYFVYKLFKILSYPGMPGQKLIAISLISVFCTYGFTGHYLITGGVGIIYGALGGIIIRLFWKTGNGYYYSLAGNRSYCFSAHKVTPPLMR